jgi:Tol biopolymer transport system component
MIAAGCTGSPTGGGEPELLPTGTILAGSPNNPEYGSYLIDVETGTVTQIATRQNPFLVALQGGYSSRDDLVYGVRADSATGRVVAVSLTTGDTTLLAEMPDDGHLLGAVRLSPDGRTLAMQVWQWRIDKIETVLIDLATGTWNRLVDQATGIDAIPLDSFRWAPDGRFLYALTEVFPDRSELVRIDPTTAQFEIISPTTPITGPLWIDLSPDGKTVAHGDGSAAILYRDADGELLGGFPEVQPRVMRPTWSPDGKFLAYQELGSEGEGAIILMRLSDGKRWPLEIEGGLRLWLADWF